MDYVYICRGGDNEELRYSIRSVVKNMPRGRIWVVGEKPYWYTGNFIHVPQNKIKTRNAIANLEHVYSSDEIQEDFVLMNDDFFAVKPIKKIKYYHGGLLKDRIELYDQLTPDSTYIKMLQETHRRLLRHGIENPLDYDLHVPMPMTKTNLRISMKGITLWRSNYGNIFEVGGEQISDVKVYESGPLLKRSYDYTSMKYDYISTDDQSFEKVYNDILRDMFPNPSPYER